MNTVIEVPGLIKQTVGAGRHDMSVCSQYDDHYELMSLGHRKLPHYKLIHR